MGFRVPCRKPWRLTRGHAPSVQQALSARSSGGLAAAWARGVQAGSAVCAMLVPKELKFEHSGGIKAMTTEQIERSIEIIKEILAHREAAPTPTLIQRVP